MRFLVIAMIQVYQMMVRPFLIGNCKFQPTCSHYAAEAVQNHGVIRGGWLALTRVCRCHPFGPGGIDPIPPGEEKPSGMSAASIRLPKPNMETTRIGS